MTDKPLSSEEFEAALRAVGAERYHNLHPFHKLLHGGHATKAQMQAWALNRYVYQAAIPRKDAALMSRIHDREIRRVWIQRILDHDGIGDDKGGIERWLVLTDGLGLDRDYVVSRKGVLPATTFAVEAYVRCVTEGTQLEAICSCLTELFAPSIHREPWPMPMNTPRPASSRNRSSTSCASSATCFGPSSMPSITPMSCRETSRRGLLCPPYRSFVQQ